MATGGWKDVTVQDITRRQLGKRKTPAKARSKYNARRTTVDNIMFASAKEAQRYQELRTLAVVGEIHHLILQPRYGLYVTPFHRVGVEFGEVIKCGDYVGDFQYDTVQGLRVVEDVKGMKTPVYRLKKKLVEALYGIQIREI